MKENNGRALRQRKTQRGTRKNGARVQGARLDDNGFELALWDNLVAVKLVRLAEILSRGATQVYEADFGIRNTELRILLLLNNNQQLSVNEISRQTRVDKAWISRSLDAMTNEGFVSRVPHPSDTRKSLLSLTRKGDLLLRSIKPIALDRNRHLLTGLSERAVHRVLDALYERAEELLEPKPSLRPKPKARRRSRPNALRG